VLVVPANAPYKSVGELVAFAKANPGKLSFGSGSSSSRIAGEMLKQLAGVDILHVPYKSNPLAITDLLGGQINLMITDVSTGVPQIKAGKLRALGYSTPSAAPAARCAHHCRSRRQRLRHGLLVCRLRPAHTPAPVVARLNQLLTTAVGSAAAKSFFEMSGSEPDHHPARAGTVPGGRNPEVGPGDQGRGHHTRMRALPPEARRPPRFPGAAPSTARPCGAFFLGSRQGNAVASATMRPCS
jgi:tripartite-type tricarboxylate transporter receptor subunit TctC